MTGESFMCPPVGGFQTGYALGRFQFEGGTLLGASNFRPSSCVADNDISHLTAGATKG